MGSKDSARFNGQGEDGRGKKTEEDEEVERESFGEIFFLGEFWRDLKWKKVSEREREFWGDLKF